MDYQEEIEKLLQIDSIKEYYKENPYINNGNNYIFYKLLLKQYNYLQQQQQQQETQATQATIMQRIEERRIKNQEELKQRQEREYQEYQKILQATQEIAPPGIVQADHQQSDQNNLLFIHNSRQWQLLKESVKQGVFIDKMLVIISHEFLLYERQEIEIKLENLMIYLSLENKKSNEVYIRKEIKKISDFLIENDFVQKIGIKNSVLICTISTLFMTELKEKRIITKIPKNALSLSSDQFKIVRIKSFFENNLKIKQNELNIESLIVYFKDTNKNRKKNEIKKLLDIL